MSAKPAAAADRRPDEGRENDHAVHARRERSRGPRTGEGAAARAGRHVGRCEACREYARTAATLSTRLAGDRAAFLAAVPEFPLKEADATRGPDGKGASPSPLLARPSSLPVAAAGLVVAAAAFLVFRVVPREPVLTAEERAAAGPRSSPSSPRRTVSGASPEAESSLEKENRIWESSVVSAVEYLQARLNIRIERREPPRKPL